MLEQYLLTEICARKYIHDITKWFCRGKKRTLEYHLMKSDHRTVDGKFIFPQSPKKVIMTSSFDLGEESFALGKKIHRDKRKRGYQDCRKEHTQKRILKMYSMHASEPTPVLLSWVIVLEFSGFQEPLYDRSKGKGSICFSCWKQNSCSKEFILTQRKYPGHFGRSPVQQQITGMELQNVLQFCKVLSASC